MNICISLNKFFLLLELVSYQQILYLKSASTDVLHHIRRTMWRSKNMTLPSKYTLYKTRINKASNSSDKKSPKNIYVTLFIHMCYIKQVNAQLVLDISI